MCTYTGSHLQVNVPVVAANGPYKYTLHLWQLDTWFYSWLWLMLDLYYQQYAKSQVVYIKEAARSVVTLIVYC